MDIEPQTASRDVRFPENHDTEILLRMISGDVVAAARSLIGCRLIRFIGGGSAVYRIIETEAYHESEPGSHSYKGVTSRTKTMFGRAGLLYVYFIYGMYHCANVVAGREGEGAAVLLRALERVDADDVCRGIIDADFACYERISAGSVSLERVQTDAKPSHSLAGPGRLCRELGITRLHNGLDLLDADNGELLLLPHAYSDAQVIESSARIGISKATDLEWRFFDGGNPRVCKSAKISRRKR